MPVVINGNIETLEDAQRILNLTQAHAIMVARGFLRNPLFLMSDRTTLSTNSEDESDPSNVKTGTNTVSSPWADTPLYMAASYLDYVEKYPPPSPLYIRTHFRWIFRQDLEPDHKYNRDYTDWKVRLWTFLVRPYLETIYQFRQILVLYARLQYATAKDDNGSTVTASDDDGTLSGRGMPLPKSLANFPEVSFQDIRHNIESQALDEDDAAAEGGLALGLFD